MQSIDAVRKDGSVLSTLVEQRRGSAEHPLGRHEVEQKFRRLAESRPPRQSIDELIELVGALECEPNLNELMSLITTAAGPLG